MSVTTKKLNAKLKLYKDNGDEREYIVKSVDLEYKFEPKIGEYEIVWRVVFQRTVSNPNVFKFREVRCSYPQVSWIPFMLKKLGNELIRRLKIMHKKRQMILRKFLKNNKYILYLFIRNNFFYLPEKHSVKDTYKI